MQKEANSYSMSTTRSSLTSPGRGSQKRRSRYGRCLLICSCLDLSPDSSLHTAQYRDYCSVVQLLINLADRAKLRKKIDAMFNGEKINLTEDRAVLHVALRAPRNQVRTGQPALLPCALWPLHSRQ